MTETASPVLVCGMHRSHTSVLAQWLHNCGLFVGGDFASASLENPTGYWEDQAFVTIHEEVLKFNSKDPLTASSDIQLLPEHRTKALKLLSKRNEEYANWGWKDPRTCILYNALWSHLLGDHFLIAVMRPYKEVVNSLMLRVVNERLPLSSYKSAINKIDLLSRQVHSNKVRELARTTELHNTFLESWIVHNKAILEIADRVGHDRRLTLSPGESFDDVRVIQYLNTEWDLRLSYSPFSTLWKRRKRLGSINYEFQPQLIEQAEDISERLLALRNETYADISA